MLARTLAVFALLIFAVSASTQAQQRSVGERVEVTPPATPEQSVPHKYELNVFGGGSFMGNTDNSFNTDVIDGGVLGTSFTWNTGDKWAIEAGLSYYGVNNLSYETATNSRVGLGSRIFQFSVDPVYHFSGRTSRVRPYVSAGLGVNRYYPTRDAAAQVPTIQPPSAASALAPLDASSKAAFNYGGGIKFRVSDSIGLRFDARGLMSGSPDFHVVPTDGILHGFQPTVGLNFWFGKEPRDREYERTITVTQPAPPPPPPPNSISLNQIQGGGEVCGGTPVNLSVAAVTSPANVPLQYQWAVNGTNSGGNQNTFTFTPPDAGGDQRVTVTITDTSQGPTRAPQPVTVTQTIRVRPYVRPTIRVAAGATEVDFQNASVPVTATVQGECGGAITTTWAASEGRITPNAQNSTLATFDASTVAFGPAVPTDQVKQITITGTARDNRNQTANGTAQLSVRRKATAVQLADILFVRGSSRVNNCGQRILTDDVYPQFRNGYSIVLVGHTDAGEPRIANLDRDRAYNVGRLLVSGGRSPSNQIDRANIKVDWVGTDQTAPRNSRQCQSSVREAPGNTISASDAAAPNRRVEIWLVPNGAAMPPSVRNPRDLPR